MNITITRTTLASTYTIGRLSINSIYMCDTLEDCDRHLAQHMPLATLKTLKVRAHTAIPTGTYRVAWTYSPKFGTHLPELLAVPAFSGIRIHSGNTADDTQGCIILGENKSKGKVLNSRATCARVLPLIEKAIKNNETVTVTVTVHNS